MAWIRATKSDFTKLDCGHIAKSLRCVPDSPRVNVFEFSKECRGSTTRKSANRGAALMNTPPPKKNSLTTCMQSVTFALNTMALFWVRKLVHLAQHNLLWPPAALQGSRLRALPVASTQVSLAAENKGLTPQANGQSEEEEWLKPPMLLLPRPDWTGAPEGYHGVNGIESCREL